MVIKTILLHKKTKAKHFIPSSSLNSLAVQNFLTTNGFYSIIEGKEKDHKVSHIFLKLKETPLQVELHQLT